MLDFYFIADEQPSTFPAAQAEYAGGIKMLEFEQAQHAQIIDYNLDFFKDFRWSSVQVKEKLIIVQNDKSTQFSTLQNILQRATQMNCGVMAIGD